MHALRHTVTLKMRLYSYLTYQEPVDPFVIGQKYNPVNPRQPEPDRFVIGGEYVEPAGPNNCLGPLCGGGVIEDRDNQVSYFIVQPLTGGSGGSYFR